MMRRAPTRDRRAAALVGTSSARARVRSAVFAIFVAAGCSAARPGASPTLAEVRWPAESEVDRGLIARLSPELRAQVESAPVPVLLPPALDYGRAKMTVEPAYYALSAPDDGVTIALQATKRGHHWDDVAPATGSHRLRGVGAFISKNEEIRTASWIENGVAYVLDVECERRLDLRCADDRYTVALIESLRFAGGHR